MRCLFLLIILLALVVTCYADIALPVDTGPIIYVSPEGSDSNDGLSWEHAKLTVQEALRVAPSSSSVWVAAGTYTTVTTFRLKSGVRLYGGFAGTEISREQRDWKLNKTILQGIELNEWQIIVTAEPGAIIIDGFTIQNGGKGVSCVDSSPIISHNRIQNVREGVYSSIASPTISGNIIVKFVNAGVRCEGGSPHIINSTIADSIQMPPVTGIGAGVIVGTADTYPCISNNIIAYNSYGIHSSKLYVEQYTNCISQNATNYFGLLAHESNIDGIPLFVNKSEGDYHILETSPCIDAGIDFNPANTDIDGQLRRYDAPGVGRINQFTDIGADEFGTTPIPAVPTVTDQGATTSDHSRLYASWISSDAIIDVTEYQYAIGTSPTVPGIGQEDQYVVGWTYRGLNRFADHTLTLTNDQTYYFYVKARNRGGEWSAAGVSDGITCVPGDETTVGPLSFDPPSGPYWYCLGVTIRCSTEGAQIRYTISDTFYGPEPTETTGLIYDPNGSVVVNISESNPLKVIKAKAFKAGLNPSLTYTAAYRFETPYDPGTPPEQVTYTCWKSKPVDPFDPLNFADVCLQITDIYHGPLYEGHTETMCLKWWGKHNKFDVKRKLASDPTPWDQIPYYLLHNTEEKTYADKSGFDFDTTYLYAVRGTGWVTPLPVGLSEENICTHTPDQEHTPFMRYVIDPSEWTEVSVTPVQVKASANQAVDWRLDAREVDEVPINFQFQESAYNGGLFVGYAANDPSRIGRSYIKFDPLPQPPVGERLWTGSVNTYYVKSFQSDPYFYPITQVGCHFISDDDWTDKGADCIVWDWATNLNLGPTSPIESQTVGPDNIVPPGYWCRWNNMFALVTQEMYGDGALSLALARVNEPDLSVQPVYDPDGWAYFAKKEYDSDLAPQILYALGSAPVAPILVELNSSTVKGGNSVGGTVWINGPAPAGGAKIYISVPSCIAWSHSVIVPQGSVSASFVVSTAVVSVDTDINVTAWKSICAPAAGAPLRITVE